MLVADREVEEEITITLKMRDWVWLCQTLVAVKNRPELDQMSKYDYDRVVACMEALEAGV